MGMQKVGVLQHRLTHDEQLTKVYLFETGYMFTDIDENSFFLKIVFFNVFASGLYFIIFFPE